MTNSLDLISNGKNFAHVAIPREGTDPRVVLVWAKTDDDGNIRLNSAEGRAWPEDLRAAGRAIITVANHENPYEYLTVTARLAGDTHDGAEDEIDALAKKYLGQDRYPHRRPGEVRVTVKVTPEKIQSMG